MSLTGMDIEAARTLAGQMDTNAGQAGADIAHRTADTSPEAVENIIDAGGGILHWINRKAGG